MSSTNCRVKALEKVNGIHIMQRRNINDNYSDLSSLTASPIRKSKTQPTQTQAEIQIQQQPETHTENSSNTFDFGYTNVCIPVYLKRATHFMLPRENKYSMIMVGPGTGVAPFRAFMQQRSVDLKILKKSTGTAHGQWRGFNVGLMEEDSEIMEENSENIQTENQLNNTYL